MGDGALIGGRKIPISAVAEDTAYPYKSKNSVKNMTEFDIWLDDS